MTDPAHILIVDDEEDLRELLAQMLESEGYKISQASGGKAALEILNKQKIDLVVSDVRMPEGDGVFLLKEIRRKDPQNPVVLMMTGFSDTSDEQMLKLGAHAMLMKPFDTELLTKTIQQALLSAKAAFKK